VKDKGDEGEERMRKERRRRNTVWRGIEGEDGREREDRVRKIIQKVLGRRVGVREIEERLSEGGRRILLVIMRGRIKRR